METNQTAGCSPPSRRFVLRRLALALGVFAAAAGLLAGATHWLSRKAASIAGQPLPGLIEQRQAGRQNAGVTRGRVVYPYSVIPGGILTPEELEAAAERDPVVREHYKDLDLTQLRAAPLGSDRFAYVSYRKDGKVYWTRNKHRLAEGELVLAGEACDLVRGRCGNRISEVAMTPVAEVEPSEEVLNTAMFPEPEEPLRAAAMPEDPDEKVLEAPLLTVAPSPAAAPIGFAAARGMWPKPWWLLGPLLAIAPFMLAEPDAGGPPDAEPPLVTPPPEGPPAVPPSPPAEPPVPPAVPPGTPPAPPPGGPPAEPPPPVTPPSQPPAGPPPGPPEGPPSGPPPGPPSGPPAGPPPGPPSGPPPGPPPHDPPWAPPPGPPPGPPPSPPPSGPPAGPPPSVPPDFPPVTPIPEPSFYALLGVGLAGLMVAVRRRRR